MAQIRVMIVKLPSSANSMGNETDHKHPSCNDDECKGHKAMNKNDVVNTDVNVGKNAQIDHANADSPKGTAASSDIVMILVEKNLMKSVMVLLLKRQKKM